MQALVTNFQIFPPFHLWLSLSTSFQPSFPPIVRAMSSGAAAESSSAGPGVGGGGVSGGGDPGFGVEHNQIVWAKFGKAWWPGWISGFDKEKQKYDVTFGYDGDGKFTHSPLPAKHIVPFQGGSNAEYDALVATGTVAAAAAAAAGGATAATTKGGTGKTGSKSAGSAAAKPKKLEEVIWGRETLLVFEFSRSLYMYTCACISMHAETKRTRGFYMLRNLLCFASVLAFRDGTPRVFLPVRVRALASEPFHMVST